MNERFNLVRAHHAKTPEGQYYAGVSIVEPGKVVRQETVRHGEHTANTVENAYLGALKGAAGELCPQVSGVNQARAFVDENDRTASYVQIIADGAVVTEPVAQVSPNGTSYWVQPEGAAVVRAIEHYVIFRSSTACERKSQLSHFGKSQLSQYFTQQKNTEREEKNTIG